MINQNIGVVMILLVEDDRSLCRGISYALEKKGFCIKSVGTLKDAAKERESVSTIKYIYENFTISGITNILPVFRGLMFLS